jgi:hypothetical protein
MELPDIGAFEKDEDLDWYMSSPLPIPVLGNAQCSIVVEGYDDDPAKEDFHTAIRNFLSIGPSVLKDIEPHVFNYYQDCNRYFRPGDEQYLDIRMPEGVWRHIQLGLEANVSRSSRTRDIYISLECNCDWEPEHGLLIVFKNGIVVNKIGPYDGHLTNSDAFGDNDSEDVVYRALRHSI